jgi:hypothetical protein
MITHRHAWFENRDLHKGFLGALRDHVERGLCCRGTQGSFAGPHGSWQGTAVVCGLRALDLYYGHRPRTFGVYPDDLAMAINFPCELVRLFDWTFENIPDEDLAQRWALRFFSEVPAGLELNPAWPALLALLPNSLPAGLVKLLREWVEATRIIEDDEWLCYRAPDGLGVPAASAVAELVSAVIRRLEDKQMRVTRLSEQARTVTHAQADALIRRICSA